MRISYVNGRYEQHAEAMVHIEDRGYQFADGIYEYVAFYNRRLLDGDLHLRRLERSLKELQLPLPMSLPALSIVVQELIRRNDRDDGGLYIQVTRGVASRNHPFPKNVKPALVMTICGAKTPKAQEVENGVKVVTAPDIRWKRCDIKTISLLGHVLAKQQAAKVSAREALVVDEDGTVREGAASNVYIVTSSGELVTHHCDEHVLPGIARDVVLKLAQKAGIRVAERPFNMAEIKTAAEAFITSTSINVLPVVKVDDITIGKGKPGPVTQKLAALYNAYVFKQTGKQF